MNQGWEIKKLGEIVEIINGKNQSQVSSENGKFPIYGSAGNLMGYANDYLCEKGTTIIGRKGNISNPIFINERFWNVDTAFGIYPINGHDPKFIHYLCQTIDFKSRNKGTTIPSLVKSDLLSIDVVFNSSLPEQQRIVSILDKTFAAIDKAKANAEQNLRNAKEVFESYLQGVFEGGNWEEKTIKEITKVINGYAFASSDFKPTNTVKSVKITNVGVKEFVEEVDNYLPEKFKDTLRDFQVREGNIVIALTRTIISAGLKVAVVPANYDGALINQRVAALVPNEKLVNQSFLYFYLTTSGVSKYVLKHVNTLMQPNLSINDLKDMPVPCPNLKEQQTIVRQLDALRAKTQKLEAIYEKKIVALEELKKSVLAKAFRGELE